jgi:hypothetical protein
VLAPRWPFGCLIAVAIADVGVTGCNFGEAASWFGVVLMLPGVGAMLAVQLLPTRRRAATAGNHVAGALIAQCRPKGSRSIPLRSPQNWRSSDLSTVQPAARARDPAACP